MCICLSICSARTEYCIWQAIGVCSKLLSFFILLFHIILVRGNTGISIKEHIKWLMYQAESAGCCFCVCRCAIPV